MISKNYHLIKNHPIASKLFPRENLVAGTKRLPNLSEILSPTVQAPAPAPATPDQGGPGGGGGEAGGGGGGGQDEGGGVRPRRAATGGSTRGRGYPDNYTFSHEQSDAVQNGSFHCTWYKKSKRCDVCSHMTETRTVLSKHFKRKHAISGHNVHLKATEQQKLRWFVYLEEDTSCELQYVGSTSDMTHRWANTKKRCNDRNSNGTGLEEHFKTGCPCDTGEKKSHISITLLEHMDVTTT